MRFLSLGTGVIGTTYAWQLAEAGHDVTLLVRPGRKEMYEASGIRFVCTDGRHGRQVVRAPFRPPMIETLTPDNDFDFILASPRSDQMEAVLDMLGHAAGDTNIVLFSNIWFGPEHIEKYLKPNQYLFAMSFNVGGGRRQNEITCTIFGTRLAATMIGEKDGIETPRLKALAAALESAHMRPRIQRNMLAWLWTHYAEMACFIGGICRGESAAGFVEDPAILRDTFLAIRETREVCRRRGIRPRPSVPLVSLPMKLYVPAARRVLAQPAFTRLIDGYRANTTREMRRMYYDVLNTGRELGVAFPHFAGFQSDVDAYVRRHAGGLRNPGETTTLSELLAKVAMFADTR